MSLRKRFLVLGIFAFDAALLGVTGCGSSDAQTDSEMIPVNGVAGFGTQCPQGTISHPKATKLQLWNCPLELDELRLSQPLSPLFFQVDCRKRILTIRMDNRVLDTAWELNPDGSFNIRTEAGIAQLDTTGGETGACTSPMTADIFGKADCRDADKVALQFETVYWLGKTRNPDLMNQAGNCKLPGSCYLYTSATIQQCE